MKIYIAERYSNMKRATKDKVTGAIMHKLEMVTIHHFLVSVVLTL